MGLLTLTACFLNFTQPAAHAASVFTVNSTGDGADSNTADNLCNDGAGHCTLRAAIQQANATSGADTINFSITGTINLTGKLPDIFTDININGPGPATLIVRRDTGGDYIVLTVSPGAKVNVSGLTLTNGKARDGINSDPGGSPDKGGGVANFGTLNLTNVVVTGNRGGNGGNGTRFGATGGEGAGIYNFGGTLTMKDCAVTNNVTGQGGNGPDRAGSGGDGGGIFNAGTLTLTDCLVSGNRTGPAGDSPSGVTLTTGGNGAGIYSDSGTITLVRVTVRDNITGNGGVNPQPGDFGRGGQGAGFLILHGVGRLKDCTISGNRVGLRGGSNGLNGLGGGVFNNNAVLTIDGSTISDNTGDNANAILNFGLTSVTNSTVSGNHVIQFGECIYNVNTLTLSNSTIFGNEGVGVRNSANAPVVKNTIIAGNGLVIGGIDVQDSFNSQGHNIVGNAGTGPGTHSTGFGAGGDQVGYAAAPIDPKLGPLQDNGGPTLTHATLAGSPALDAGSNSLARDGDDNPLTTDQRGVGRFAGPGVTPTVDIGAFELNPFMEDISDQATNEDTPLSFVFFVGDQTVTSLTATSDNQTLVPDGNINISAGGTMRTVQINPSADRFGTANITIHLNGSNEGMVTQTFALVVAPINDTPSFTKGADQTVLEDAGAQTVTNWATAVSAGPNESAQTLTFLITGNTNPGLFSSAPAVSPAGALTYTPAPDANGSATITLLLKDNGGTANGGQDTSASQTFVINVTPVNDPPVANSGTLTTDEDVSTFASFAGSDIEGDSLTFAVVTAPSHGTLSGTGSGRTYTPAANYNGADSFTYKAIDAHGAESAPATISLTINAVNDAPTLNAIGDINISEDAGPQTVNLGGISAGPNETQGLTVTATSSNTALVPHPTVTYNTPNAAGSISFAPTANANGGPVTITVTVKDDGGTANGGVNTFSRAFTVTVTAVNDAPTLNTIGDLSIDEDAGTQTVNLGGISAGPNETQGLTVTATSSNTALVPHPTVTYLSPNANGSISFTPAANGSGAAIITVTVTDDGGTAGGGVNTISRTFNVTVNAVNDAPVNTVPGAQTTVQHTPLVFSAANSNAISVADIDAGADAIKVTLTATNGTVTLGPNAGLSFVTGDGTDDANVSFAGTVAAVNTALGGLSFKPAQGFSGAASLQIVTDDQGHNGSGGALSDTDAIGINVMSGGAFRFSSSLISAQENVGTFSLIVTRSGGSSGAATVDYATAFSPSSVSPAVGGSACAGNVDYVSTSGTLSFADGEASKAISIDICDDSRHEAEDTFSVTLSNPTGSGVLGFVSKTFVVIIDNDPLGGVFEFSQSSYNVSEGGTLTVTVRRTGDTTQAASVDYATDDGSTPSVAVPCASTTGLALDRCDFTKALGTLGFAAGETEKTFKLLVGDDSYVEGPETLQLRLSNPAGGAALGANASATVTIADDSPESAGNPIDDTTKFVTQHYRDFLNRDPDAAGLAFWVQGIESCGADAGCREVKRIDTSAAFFLSIEFQETGYLVERVFKTAYGDAPSPNVNGMVPVVRFDDFLTDTQRIGKDVVVNSGNWQQQLAANKEAYALEFVRRARFLAAFPAAMTAADFVDRLNQNAGGVLSADERAQLIASLGATPSDDARRGAALRQVAENSLFRQREFNRAFVLMQYFGYLRRNPDDAPEAGLNFAGWKFWLDKLDEFGGDYRRAEMVKAFLSADEYRKRFGQ